MMHATRRALVLAALWLVAFSIQPGAAPDASPSAILANPDRFDGQAVTIQGTVTNLRETVSRRCNPYYTFDLSDGTRAIRVFSFEKAACRVGVATVEGTFEKVKQVGRLTFHNKITATQVTCR
jgi:hypothetical protein